MMPNEKDQLQAARGSGLPAGNTMRHLPGAGVAGQLRSVAVSDGMGFAAEARRLGGTERVRKGGKGFTAEGAEHAETGMGVAEECRRAGTGRVEFMAHGWAGRLDDQA